MLDDNPPPRSEELKEVSDLLRCFPVAKTQDELEPGKRYWLAIVSLDAVGHTRLMRKYGEKNVERILTEYKSIVEESFKSYGGFPCTWPVGDGGVWLFGGMEDRCQRAVLAALRVLHNITLLNLDRTRNPLPEAFEVRFGIGEGFIKYRIPEGDIVAQEINDTVKLQSNRTRPNELNVTEDVYLKLDERLQETFLKLEGGFEKKRIYNYKGLVRFYRPTSEDLAELMAQAEKRMSFIVSVFDHPTRTLVGRVEASTVHGEVQEFYAGLRRFCDWFKDIDNRWSTRYLRDLSVRAEKLEELEQVIWTSFRRWLERVRPNKGAENEFELMSDSAQNEHGIIDRLLLTVKRNLKFHAGTLKKAQLQEDLPENLVQNLVAADDLDRLGAFMAIVDHDRSDLLTYLSSIRQEQLARRFNRAIWPYADLVLVEDLVSKPANGMGLFSHFLGDGLDLLRFRALRQILDGKIAAEQFFEQKFKWVGLEPTKEDLAVAWRALAMAHPKVGMRYEAASVAPLKALWQTVAYYRTPVSSLEVVTKRLDEGESDDLKKIFFDCVHDRLSRGITENKNPVELATIKRILEVFIGFEFFSETPYFMDLDALVSQLQARGSRFGVSFRRDHEKFTAWRKKAAKSLREKVRPAGLEELPLDVQRHLAREGRHVEWFACHDVERVALETLPYIDAELAKELGSRSQHGGRPVNSTLLAELGDDLKRAYELGFEEPEESAGEKGVEPMDAEAPSEIAEEEPGVGSKPLRQEVERKIGAGELQRARKRKRE